MRKFFVTAFVCAVIASANAQTLFTYGTHQVSKEEFLRQFNRNLDPKEDKNKAMKDYLPLFINYKLKVQDAYDKKLDTQYTQISELNDFRRQIEDNYFSEEANQNLLLDEAFARSQKDIKVQDVYITFDSRDAVSEKQAAEAAAKAAQKLADKTDFDAVVQEFTTDADFKANKGDLGWVTVFSLPYKIENAIYALKVGENTAPIKTSNAYHIFKKVAERKAVGKIKIAQILLTWPPNASQADKEAVQKRADSLYQVVVSGKALFADVARNNSMDKTSYQQGGTLQEFGIGAYERSFEDAAFALKNKGDVSKPFNSSYGIHILQLVEHTPVTEDKKDAIALGNLKQKVLSDNRMEQAKTNLVKSLLPKIGYTPAKTLNKKLLWQYTDSVFKNAGDKVKNGITEKTEIFKFSKQSIKAGDWGKFARAMSNGTYPSTEKAYEELMDKYVLATAAEYYKKHLEEFNPDFKSQLREFKDANLNFEVTEKMVWNKAAEDNEGLKRLYEINKSKYKWAPSVNAIILTGTDKTTADDARKELEANIADWRKVSVKYENKLLADSNRFEQNQVPVNAAMDFKAHMFTPMVANAQDGSQTFCYIVNVMNEPGQRSFDEARGFVINDYQQILETKWIEGLKKKYPVKVNDTLWQGLVKK